MSTNQYTPSARTSSLGQKVGALSTYLQSLERLSSDGKKLRFFRGHAKSSFELIPSIYRNRGWIENEATMLKELILRCPNDFGGELTTFQCLVKMQHYGLPTRLLDVTSNPLVALYFAAEAFDKNNEDGEVIVYDYDVADVKYFDSDMVSVIANLSRRPSDFVVPEIPTKEQDNTEASLESFNKCEDIKLLLHDIRNEKPHFIGKIRRRDLQQVICVKPLLDNPRIIRQEGAFLLFGCDNGKSKPAELGSEKIVARLTINRDQKRKLRDQLHSLGISRATMYPEIEHVAMHIKQSYASVNLNPLDLTEIQRKVYQQLSKGDAFSTA